MKSFSAVAVLSVVGASVFAHADTFQQFDVNAVLETGDALTGTLTLDTTTNLFYSVDVSTTIANTTYRFAGEFGDVQGNEFGDKDYEAAWLSNPNDAASYGVYVLLPIYSPKGYDGSYLCSLNQLCGFYQNSSVVQTSETQSYFVQSGTVTPAAATPEPGSLVLLGTGVVGAFGVIRRRVLRG